MQDGLAAQVRVLGPLDVSVAGRTVALGGAQPRLLFAALALHVNAVVSADVLVDLLWGELPPDSRGRTLPKALYRLRAALDTAATTSGAPELLIETRPSGYALVLDGADLDADRFETLVGDAHDCAQQDPSHAARLLDDALALWRGRPWAEFADEHELFRADAARLDAVRAGAMEDRAEAGLALGRHRELIIELDAIAAEYPLRERPRAQLMLALYRSGRQVEALRVFSQFRSYLIDEVGVEPSVALQQLEDDILLQKPHLDLPSETTLPGPSVTVLPLPGPLRPCADLFVGRDRESAILTRAWTDAVGGDGNVVLIGGEPGIGKTRLVTELARRVTIDGGGALYGRCDDDLRVPYLPWVEALGHLVKHEERDVLVAHVAEHGGRLGQIVPELAQRVGRLPPTQNHDPDTDLYLLFSALAGLIGRACASRPILLVLEDLHWADKPSLQLLRRVIASATPQRLLIVATFRPMDIAAEHPLPDALAALHRERGVQRVDVDGLDEGDVARLVEEADLDATDEPSTVLARALFEETDGNPFFVGEILRDLTERGALHGRLPASVREVIMRRVSRLGSELEQVLSAAAVIGRDLDVELLAIVTDHDSEDILDVLDGAIRADLIRDPGIQTGALAFSHALIGHTLYEALGAARRRRLHARTATALERLCGDDPGDRVSELAHHSILGCRPGGSRKAIDYAMLAGDRASAKLAYDAAADWYQKALDLADQQSPPDQELQCRILIGLTSARSWISETRYRDTLLRAIACAQELENPDLLVRVVLAGRRQWVTEYGKTDDERVSAIEAALARSAARESPDNARLLAILASEIVATDVERAHQLSDQALVAARASRDDVTLWEVLEGRPQAIWSPATLDERTANAYEQRAVAKRLRDEVRIKHSAGNVAHVLMSSGDIAGADSEFATMFQLATWAGVPRYVPLMARSLWEILAGRLDDAERTASEGLRVGQEIGWPSALMTYSYQLMYIREAQGRLGEMVELAEMTATANPGIPGFQRFHASTLVEANRLDDARVAFEPLVASGFRLLPFDTAWLSSIDGCAYVAAALEDHASAALIADMLDPWREQLIYDRVLCRGSVAQPLGVALAAAGRFREADEAFSHAADVHERIPAPIELARTRVEWATMLVRRAQEDDEAHARVLAESALATAMELGLQSIARKAVAITRPR